MRKAGQIRRVQLLNLQMNYVNLKSPLQPLDFVIGLSNAIVNFESAPLNDRTGAFKTRWVPRRISETSKY